MELIRMSKQELYKGEIIAQVINGKKTQRQASRDLHISLRQTKRLCKRFRQEGLKGLIHRNRGKTNKRKVSSSKREQILELIQCNYHDFGPQLITEQLEKRNEHKFSREWIRQLMIQEGLWKVKKRKTTRYYQRRNRRSREGELLQIDGSPEFWFEERGPKCCLINMVDDATGKIMELRFVKEECLEGYFTCMKHYIERHGCPLAIYSDRHTIFKSPSEFRPKLTQFGRAMKELNIELIHANTPQAKGRVERSHATLQDRLIKMMRLEGISSIQEGNAYLEQFRQEYNQLFGKEPRLSENAHRKIERATHLEKILCKKEQRKVSKNLEIQYNHGTYQITPKGNGNRLIGKSVQIYELNGEVKIEFEGEEYEYKIFNEQPNECQVKDRKLLDAFLDRKQPVSAIQKHRQKRAYNF